MPSWDDEAIQAYGAAHPFRIVKCGPALSNFSTVAFEVFPATASAPAKVVSPEDVGTEVLKYLLKVTSSFLGHNQVRTVCLNSLSLLTPPSSVRLIKPSSPSPPSSHSSSAPQQELHTRRLGSRYPDSRALPPPPAPLLCRTGLHIFP